MLKKLTGLVSLAVVLSLAAGCAYQVPTKVKPSYSVYTAYDQKLPGRAAVYVDASKARDTVKVTGLTCSAHNFPVDAESEIETAVVKTVANIMEGAEKVDRPLSRDELASYGVDAMVMVKVEDMDIDLVVIPGFWQAEMESEVDLAMGVKVDTKSGRKVGKMVSGSGEYRSAIGGACEGGAIAISEALEEALTDAFTELGEEIANSERLRSSIR